MTRTSGKFLGMLLTSPKIWLFVQLLLHQFGARKEGIYSFKGHRPHKLAVYPDEVEGMNTREYQKVMLPFFRRALSAYYAGYLQEAMEICRRVLPLRPFDMQVGVDHYDCRGERLLFREDRAWEGFLEFFFPGNKRLLRTIDGKFSVVFEADSTVTQDKWVDREELEALMIEQRTSNEIVKLHAECSVNDLIRVEITRRNTDPPAFKDFSFNRNDPLQMRRKSKRKRERKRLWRRA